MKMEVKVKVKVKVVPLVGRKSKSIKLSHYIYIPLLTYVAASTSNLYSTTTTVYCTIN